MGLDRITTKGLLATLERLKAPSVMEGVLLDKISAGTTRMTELVDLVYGDRADGGPDNAELVIRTTIWNLKHKKHYLITSMKHRYYMSEGRVR